MLKKVFFNWKKYASNFSILPINTSWFLNVNQKNFLAAIKKTLLSYCSYWDLLYQFSIHLVLWLVKIDLPMFYFFRLRIYITTMIIIEQTSSSTTTITPEINNNSPNKQTTQSGRNTHRQEQLQPSFVCVREFDLGSAVTCIEHTFTHVYAGLENGQIMVFEIAGQVIQFSVKQRCK